MLISMTQQIDNNFGSKESKWARSWLNEKSQVLEEEKSVREALHKNSNKSTAANKAGIFVSFNQN